MDAIANMNAAMRLIEQHLEGALDYGQLFRAAGCSEYHFRRVFAHLAGMPLGEYIRLRRLSTAATLLKSSGRTVTELALAFGYESPEAFAKAFAALHGISPSQARKSGVGLKAFPPMTFQMSIRGGTVMQYRIERKDAFRIAGIRKRITLVYQGVNTQMDSMWSSLTPDDFVALKQLSNTEPRGILCASANFTEGREQGSELDQYIGVATTLPVPDRWSTLDVAACEWAVFTAVGKFPEALQEIWARIYAEWLPSSGYEVVPGPELLWNESPDTEKPDYKSEIWIPVAHG